MAKNTDTEDYFFRIQRGVDYIEENLDVNLSLADVAGVSGLSAWHFQRVFKAFTQETLKGYIRLRRLSIALERLTGSEAKILDIALLAGFESQESFTRAFKKIFTITPAEARKLRMRNPYFEKAVFDRDYLQHLSEQVSVQPEFYQQPALQLVGMQTDFYGEESEKNNMGDKLPRLWESFLSRSALIRDPVPDIAYGVIRQTSRGSELLEYTAASVVTTVNELPSEMVVVEVPAARYAKFAHRGMPSDLNNTINYIYSSWLMSSGLRHTYGVDLVSYGVEYIPDDDNSIIYYAIPVE